MYPDSGLVSETHQKRLGLRDQRFQSCRCVWAFFAGKHYLGLNSRASLGKRNHSQQHTYPGMAHKLCGFVRGFDSVWRLFSLRERKRQVYSQAFLFLGNERIGCRVHVFSCLGNCLDRQGAVRLWVRKGLLLRTCHAGHFVHIHSFLRVRGGSFAPG